MQRILKPLGSLGMLLLGLLLLPILLIANFGLIKDFFSGLFSGVGFVSLNEKNQRQRLTFRQLLTTPSLETRQKVEKEVWALIEADNWLALSTKIVEWDQSRSRCEAGFPLAHTAMTAAIQFIARGVYEGHICHPGPIYDISDEVADMLETKAAIHSDSYALLALAAAARCYQGWCDRGDDYAEYVSDDGWFGMSARFAKARWLLDRFDPVALDAPLLAATRHKLLAFMPDAEKHVYRYYEEWSALDPYDQTPHTAHGQMMLLRWFGDQTTLEVEARKAAQATSQQTGDAAYFSIYASAFEAWDPNVLNIDLDVFEQGAHDLITLRGGDPAFVAQLHQQMSWWANKADYREATKHIQDQATTVRSGIKELRDEILRTRLTAIHGHSWEGGVRGAIDEISALVQAEIEEGHATFALTESGLVVTPGMEAAPRPA